LKETSVIVKKNAVTVLTQLIAKEMVKVRGQIAELALCLLDNEPSIAGFYLTNHYN
jgi:condensin complex subunit 1